MPSTRATVAGRLSVSWSLAAPSLPMRCQDHLPVVTLPSTPKSKITPVEIFEKERWLSCFVFTICLFLLSVLHILAKRPHPFPFLFLLSAPATLALNTQVMVWTTGPLHWPFLYAPSIPRHTQDVPSLASHSDSSVRPCHYI